jgi:hypothetical protein
LKRYGAINPQAYEVLNPPIGRLIELMLAMDGAAKGRYAAHYFPNFFCRSISLNSTLRIFPEIVLGKLSTNSISRGYL